MRVLHASILLCLLSAAHDASAFETVMDYLTDGFLRVVHTLSSPHSVRRRDADDDPEDEDRQFHATLLFTNCGNTSDPVYVESFNVTPNPIMIPGDMTLAIRLNVKEGQSAPIPVKIEIKKKLPSLFGSTSWITIPCLPNGIGSCPVEDLCTTKVFKNNCTDPETDKTIPCGCPFEEGLYSLKPVTFQLPEIPDEIPDYLLEGDIYVKATAIRDGRQIACYSTNITIAR